MSVEEDGREAEGVLSAASDSLRSASDSAMCSLLHTVLFVFSSAATIEELEL